MIVNMQTGEQCKQNKYNNIKCLDPVYSVYMISSVYRSKQNKINDYN